MRELTICERPSLVELGLGIGRTPILKVLMHHGEDPRDMSRGVPLSVPRLEAFSGDVETLTGWLVVVCRTQARHHFLMTGLETHGLSPEKELTMCRPLHEPEIHRSNLHEHHDHRLRVDAETEMAQKVEVTDLDTEQVGQSI